MVNNKRKQKKCQIKRELKIKRLDSVIKENTSPIEQSSIYKMVLAMTGPLFTVLSKVKY